MSDTDTPAPKRSLAKRLADVRPSDLVILFVLCVLVGLILAFFNVDPADLWVDFFATVGEAWQSFFEALGDIVVNALRYFLLGAVVIVPIWFIWHVLKAVTRRE